MACAPLALSYSTSEIPTEATSFDSTFVPEQLCLTFESTGLRPGELHG